MCGIVASYAPGRTVDHAVIAAGLLALRPRGPDGTGRWRDAAAGVALGHTRLAVTSPEDGAQPLRVTREDGSEVVAVVNGEIYDRDGLRAQLEGWGRRFETASDSELLPQLYAREGLAAVPRLRGEFCFVLWDSRCRRLIAARDHFGTRTLVWRRIGDGVQVASEAKALFAMGAPRAWSLDALENAWAMQYLPEAHTPFAGINMLPPGGLLVAETSGVALRRWAPRWSPPRCVSVPSTPGAAAARLRELFREAVAERIPKDAPYAFHLSGGLDSAATLGAAAEVTGARLDAFCVSFPGSPLDERAEAERNAAHAGARFHLVELPGAELLADFAAAAEAGEGLAVNPHLVAHFRMDRALAAAGIKSVLSGEGSDELFAGYPHLRADLAALSGQTLDAADSPQTRGLMLPQGATLPLEGVATRLGTVPTFLRSKAGIGAWIQRWCRQAASKDPVGAALDRDHGEADYRFLRAGHPVWRASALWARYALGGYILPTLSDRLLGASGLEGRLPFLDAEVAGFAAALPLEWKIRDGVEKWILREAVIGWVPEETRQRRKHPFIAPMPGLDPSDGCAAQLDDMLSDTRFGAPAILDAAAIRRDVQAARRDGPEARRALQAPLCLALSASALGRAYGLQGVEA